jgi:hypothetical protein
MTNNSEDKKTNGKSASAGFSLDTWAVFLALAL